MCFVDLSHDGQNMFLSGNLKAILIILVLHRPCFVPRVKQAHACLANGAAQIVHMKN